MESRVNVLMSTRAGEKATLSSLERKLAEERKQKTEFQIKLETERKVKKEAATAEKTAQQNQTRSEVAKLEAEIKSVTFALRMHCNSSKPIFFKDWLKPWLLVFQLNVQIQHANT